MDLQANLLRNKSQNFAVNIFEVKTFSTKHIFDEMSYIANGHHSVHGIGIDKDIPLRACLRFFSVLVLVHFIFSKCHCQQKSSYSTSLSLIPYKESYKLGINCQ